MLTSLLAYNADGDIVATLDHCVARNEDGFPVGLIDFEAYEAGGNSLRDIWNVTHAVGSGTWPEWLGTHAHGFKVERSPQGGITALVHKASGHRRERSEIESKITERIERANGKPADIRDIVGGPDRPLELDEDGKTQPRTKVIRPSLPVVAKGDSG